MKKMLCIILAVALCACTPVYAGEIGQIDMNNPTTGEHMWVERFFEYEYVFIDFNGNDITSVFYQRMMPAYNIGDYEMIAEYYIANVDYAEYVEVESISPNGNIVLVTKIRSDAILVDELNHGFDNHNYFVYEARLKYRYDAEEDIIVRGYDPEVYDYTLSAWYGNNEPEVSISNESYVVASDGSEIQYEFSFEGEIHVNTDGWYEEVDDMNLAYSYEGTVDIFLSAGP